MSAIELNQADDVLVGYVQQASKEPVILTLNGKPYAAVVLLDDLEALQFEGEAETYRNSVELQAILKTSRDEYHANGGTRWGDVDWDALDREADELQQRVGTDSGSLTATETN